MDNETEDLAIRSLKSFFDTTSKRQVDESVKNLISYFIHKKDLRWANIIFTICTKTTHIEMRHRLMVQISHEIEKCVQKNDVQNVEFLIKVTSEVLNSHTIHFVGLPVLEILNKVIRFEQVMIEKNQSNLLKESYSELIRNLANRIYYKNQINDMIKTILSVYYYECTKNEHFKSESQFMLFSEVLSNNIRDILNICEKPGITLKRSSFPVSIFNYLYSIFGFEGYPSCQQQLQTMWLALIDEFYKVQAHELSKPNYEQCITNESDNGLCFFFEAIDQVLDSESIRPELVTQISITTASMIAAFKVNFVVNYLKFASKWLQDPKLYQYSLSLLILGLTAAQVGEEAKVLAEVADAKIAYSQLQDEWPTCLGYQPSSSPSNGVLEYEELQQLINEVPDISKWCNRIDTSHSHSTSVRQPPKPITNVMVMSASTSMASFSGFNDNSTHNSLRIPSGISIGLESSLGSNISQFEGASIADSGDFTFASPSRPTNTGGRSLRSAHSMRSGRFAPRVNLADLKKTRIASIADSDLSQIVSTRTGSGMLNRSPTPLTSIPPASTTTKASSGLAYTIIGLDLEE